MTAVPAIPAISDVLSERFELVAERPGEIVALTLDTLEHALDVARRYASQGYSCLVIEQDPPDGVALEIIVTCQL